MNTIIRVTLERNVREPFRLYMTSINAHCFLKYIFRLKAPASYEIVRALTQWSSDLRLIHYVECEGSLHFLAGLVAFILPSVFTVENSFLTPLRGW